MTEEKREYVTVHQVAGGHEIDTDVYGTYTKKEAIAKAKELTADYDGEKADDDGYCYGDGYNTEVQRLSK